MRNEFKTGILASFYGLFYVAMKAVQLACLFFIVITVIKVIGKLIVFAWQ